MPNIFFIFSLIALISLTPFMLVDSAYGEEIDQIKYYFTSQKMEIKTIFKNQGNNITSPIITQHNIYVKYNENNQTKLYTDKIISNEPSPILKITIPETIKNPIGVWINSYVKEDSTIQFKPGFATNLDSYYLDSSFKRYGHFAIQWEVSNFQNYPLEVLVNCNLEDQLDHTNVDFIFYQKFVCSSIFDRLVNDPTAPDQLAISTHILKIDTQTHREWEFRQTENVPWQSLESLNTTKSGPTILFQRNFNIQNTPLSDSASLGKTVTQALSDAIANQDAMTVMLLSNNILEIPEIPIDTTEEEKKNSNGSCTDCVPPTLGLDSKGKRFVDYGVVLNGEPLEVNYFYTHMPMQYTTLDKTNHLDLKIYENAGSYNIKMVQFGMGVKEIGTPINEAQARIEISPAYFGDDIKNPKLEKFEIMDPDGIINEIDVTLALSPCGAVKEECLLVGIKWSYAKPPDYTILMTNLFDMKRNVINDYFNDGLEVIYDKPVEITPEPYKYVCTDPIQKVMTRNNCNFRALTEIWN